MRRGEEAFDKLKELALYKMNLPENVAKGWPTITEDISGNNDSFYLIQSAMDGLFREINELSWALHHLENTEEIKLEIADVAAYCAILLDLIEQSEKK